MLLYRYKLNPDLSFTEQKVICIPDISLFTRHTINNTDSITCDAKQQDLLVLACDGIFEVMDNIQTVRHIREEIGVKLGAAVGVKNRKNGIKIGKYENKTSGTNILYSDIARSLVKTCLKLNSTDNMSVIIAPI